MSAQEIVSALGIGRNRLSARNLFLGILIFLAIFAISLSTGIIGAITGTQISTNTSLILASEPLWFYIFTFTITPLCEEALFRGLMVPRLGIIISAIIFGLGHASYDSTFAIDVIVAIVFGLIAGWAFKKTKSLYPSMLAHGLVNLLAVVAFVF